MTTFHLIRHGAHDLLDRTLAGRMAGVGLNAAGRAQAEVVARSLAGALAGSGIGAVISSPRQRAMETAAPIAAALGVTVTPDDGLEEIDFGDWTGRDFPALNADPDWQAFNTLRSLAPTPGGETMLAAQARAVGAVQRLHAAHPDAALALVSHADTIKAILAYAMGVPLDLFGRIEIAPASRSVLVLDRGGPWVRGVNWLAS